MKHMHVSPPRRSAAGLTAALITVVTVLAGVAAPAARAELPVERAHHRATVYKVKVDPRLFGVHDTNRNSLHRAGTGSIRLWDANVMWRDIFPSAGGDPDWSRLDTMVQEAHDNGTEVTLVLGTTPSYAAANPVDAGNATAAPDLAMYTDYVRAVMTRYSAANWHDSDGNPYRGIAAYQVWNESNIATFWTGTYGQLGELVKAVHDVRDEVDPGVKVVAPAMVTRLGYQQKGIKDFYATTVDGKPVWSYVDVISLNLYPLDAYPAIDPTRAGTPEDSMALLATVRGLLAKDGVPSSIPIWDTEVNYGLRWGSNGGQPATPVSDNQQVAFVMRTYLLNAAQGIKRVDWYAYDMSQRGTLGPLGNTLLTDPVDRAAGTLTPAGLAFTRVQGWMRGTMIGTASKRPCIPDRNGTYTCLIKYAHGVGRVYWNPYRTAKVKLARSASKKVTQDGVASRARGGTKLKVGYRPVLVRSKK
jgi:hypothetical protein